VASVPPTAVGSTRVLSPVTYAELIDLVQDQVGRSYAPTLDARRRLLALVQEMASEHEPDTAGLLEGRTWRIASVAISGLGGVGTLLPGRLDLEPVAGLLVVRGPNGSGKTSIAKALEVSLRGDQAVADEAVGDLWATALLAEGAPSAEIEVVLASGAARLTIRSELGDATGSRCAAEIADADGVRQVELGRAWKDAVQASRSCYSYARLQARLQKPLDLQEFLLELLVLGPVWQEVRDELERRSERAADAARQLTKAKGQASAAERSMNERFRADPRRPRPLPDIEWPTSWDVDIDAWMDGNGLVDHAEISSVAVADDLEERAEQLRARLAQAERELSAAETHLDSPHLARTAHHLDALAGDDAIPDGECPLCGSHVDWRTHARDVVRGVDAWRTNARAVEEAVGAADSWNDQVLRPLFGSDVPGGPESAARELAAAVRADGTRAHSRAHQAARALLAAMSGGAHREWLATLRASSDAAAEWRRARVEVATAFVVSWREHQKAARDADSWTKASATLDDIQVELRQRRQDDVTSGMRTAVAAMLPEAQIEITRIKHEGKVKQRRGVQVAMTIGGVPATLGMLSSGQRNALLLAPLTMLGTTNAFGFLVVDDPIHALDTTRVDRVAAELARLASTQQVLVFTHDPRLEEHLRARIPDVGVIAVERDPATQEVTWVRHRTPWEALLAEAETFKSDSMADKWRATASVESIVTGLCRNALDGAIRHALITHAVRRGKDVADALDELGDQPTRKRIKHVVTLAGGPGVLRRTEACRDSHLDRWNSGTHGDGTAGLDLQTEIRAARRACTELTNFSW